MAGEGSIQARECVREVEERVAGQEADRGFLARSSPLQDDDLRRLDSTLKRTTAFMKKLRNIGAAQRETIICDLDKVNLSKFLEEIASTIAEAKLKTSDLASVVAICVRLSGLYGEFARLLLSEFRRVMPTKRSDKVTNPSKLRVDLRLVGELCLHGVFAKEGLQLLGSVISYLTLTDKTEHVNVPILLSFCKALGVDFLGIYSYSIQKEAEEKCVGLLVPEVILPEQKKVFCQLLLEYRQTLVEHVSKELAEMNGLLRSIKRQTRTRGDASAEERARLEETRGRYEKHLQNGILLSEALGVPMDQMHEEQSDDEEEEVSAQEMGKALQEGALSIWPDEDTRQFYESRMELRQMVPSILVQEAEHHSASGVCEAIEDVDVSGLDANVEEENAESCSEDGEENEDSVDETPAESPPSMPVLSTRIDTSRLSGQDLKLMMNSFLVQLPWLINRELIDKAALHFVTNLSTRNNRKKLCQMMLEEHHDRLDLLPFYGRFVATVQPVLPDLGFELSEALLKQFRTAVENRSKLRVDLKVRCCRFISELVKFGVIPKAEALSCIRLALYVFRSSCIEMCCSLVESMGPFLYRSVDSHPKMKVLLDVMLKKRARVTDARYQMLIDNAYYSCIPPENGEMVFPKRPIFQDFVRHVVMTTTRFRAELTVRCLRRVDWTNKEDADYTLRCLSCPSLVKFGNLPYLASVVAALSSYHDWIGTSVLDNVLEDIRMVLDVHHPSVNQKGVLAVVYLGQLYNYSVCDSPVVFKTLYQLITYGAMEPNVDDWCNLCRVSLVCQLLTICGEYFIRGSTKRKLDCFLAYFFRYYRAKVDAFNLYGVPFPNEIKFRVEEMVNYVRRDLKIPQTMEDAQQAVDDIQNQYRNMVDTVPGGERGDDESAEDEEEEPLRNVEKIGTEQTEQDIGSSARSRNEALRVWRQFAHCYTRSGDEAGTSFSDDSEDVHVHTSRVVLPEDEQFIRQLDAIVAETITSSPSLYTAPLTELLVPTSARQKFQRSLSSVDASRDSDDERGSTRMAMLTHGKGHKTVLKAISMPAPSGLAELWSAQWQQERAEFAEHKTITLSMNERMMMADEDSE